MPETQPPTGEIKWRLSFDSNQGSNMLYTVTLDRSKSIQQALKALKPAYFSNTVPWKRAILKLFHDLIVQDGVISQLCRPDLEGQPYPCKIILQSRKLESGLTTAWTQPELVVEGPRFFMDYEKFYAAPTVAALNVHDVHVCNLAWQLSYGKLVRGFRVALLLSVFVGSVVGISVGDASRGLQTIQTLVGLLTMLQGLVLTFVLIV